MQLQVDHWIKTVGVRYFSELTNAAILAEETGEVCSLIARIYGDQSFKKPFLKETAKTDLADELADVIWVVVCLANQSGIDLTQAMENNFLKKQERDKDRHHSNPKL